MVPFYSHDMPVLPQVERYVRRHVDQLSELMRRTEEKDREAVALSIKWHLIGQRPKIRNSQHFVNMMIVSLRLQLADKDFLIRDIMGLTGSMTFQIEWLPRRR